MKKILFTFLCLCSFIGAKDCLAATSLRCRTTLYFGNTEFQANLDDKTFRILQEEMVSFPHIYYKTIVEGIVIDLVTFESGMVKSIEFESEYGERGRIVISDHSMLENASNIFRHAILNFSDLSLGSHMVCN